MSLARREGGGEGGRRTDVLAGFAVRRTQREESLGPQLAVAPLHVLDLVKLPHLLDPGSPPQLSPPAEDALDAAHDGDERPWLVRGGRQGRGRVGEREGDVRVEEGERGEGRAEGAEEGRLRGGFGEWATPYREL